MKKMLKIKRPSRITKKYLEFKKQFEDTYSCLNKDKEEVGYLKLERNGRFKHWCWYSYEGFRMSPAWLQEVRDIQDMLEREK